MIERYIAPPDVNCPYCGNGEEICHDDGQGYAEEVKHTQECGNCGKIYTFTTTISFYYEAEKADCLNGADHDFQPVTTSPKEYTKMRCTMCDDERWPTDEEKDFYSIPKTFNP